jgi:mono/diheme cytochrome c family protein
LDIAVWYKVCLIKTKHKEEKIVKGKFPTIFMVILIAFILSCKGTENEESEDLTEEAKEGVVHEEQVAKAPPPIDHELAEKGSELFKTKGCIACHTIGGGRLTGPDLAGVTERRKLEWIQNMILNPDQMLEKDPIARELLATYMVKMTNQNVAPEQAQAIIMYLREKDSEKKEEAEESEHE